MFVEKLDVSDEERERRKEEADLTYSLILGVDGSDEALSMTDLDRLLGL